MVQSRSTYLPGDSLVRAAIEIRPFLPSSPNDAHREAYRRSLLNFQILPQLAAECDQSKSKEFYACAYVTNRWVGEQRERSTVRLRYRRELTNK